MRARSQALLLTPVVPRVDGVGVEQRAARLLAALADGGAGVGFTVPYRRFFGAFEQVAGPVQRALSALGDPGALLRRVALAAPRSTVAAGLIGALSPRVPADGLAGRLASLPPGPAPDRVLAFRLRAAPAALALAAGLRVRPRMELDLDDLESDTARQIASVAERAGDVAIARAYAAHAAKLEALEGALLPRFDRVFVCSRADRDALAQRFPELEVAVLPNVVDVPATPAAPPRERGPRRLLFVGALGYYPNIDAACVLAEEVLPRLRALAPGAFELEVIGRGAPGWLARRLRAAPGVRFLGEVPAMGPAYAGASAVVVPLRAGGGTRLKILEALAHGVPVVATAIGAHGLGLRDGEHLTIAETPGELARACLAAGDDPERARAQALVARELIAATATPAAFARALAER